MPIQNLDSVALKIINPISAVKKTYPLGAPFVLAIRNKNVIKPDTIQNTKSEINVAAKELNPTFLIARKIS